MQGKHVIENLSLLFVVIAREHVGTQGTLVREHVDTQDTLACEHVSTQGTQFSRLISDIFLFNISFFLIYYQLLTAHLFGVALLNLWRYCIK